MQCATFTYTADHGWSIPSFPANDSPETLVLIFGATAFLEHGQPIQAVLDAYPNSCVLGCSTSGEIHETTLRDESLTVAVTHFAKTQLRTAHAPIPSADASYEAGQQLAEELVAPALQAVLMLSDGLSVNGTALVDGITTRLDERLEHSPILTGGLAGDANRFERTWVLCNGLPIQHAVVAVGFYGEAIDVRSGSNGGWSIFGPERRITRSEDTILYELDDQPALELYKQYLGDRAAELPAAALLFPLAIRRDDDAPERLVRTILSIDESSQSMRFAGDIPEGTLAQLMYTSPDRLIDGAALAAERTQPPPDATHGLCIAISCVGRRLVLGERTEEELEAVHETLPLQTKQVGFYSYGEIAPDQGGMCDLHNQTMTLTHIHER